MKTRVGRECSISRGRGQIVQWRYTCRKSPRRESQCYEWGQDRGNSKSESCQEF